MKVGFLGSGAWGITLANLIAENGHEVLLWSIEEDVLKSLESGKGHPKFLDFSVSKKIKYTRELKDVMDADAIVECVTAKGFRPVVTAMKALGGIKQPFIITSKGIEQESGMLLVEVAYELFGYIDEVGCLSGPTLAKEVMLRHPTSAVAASKCPKIVGVIKKIFNSLEFQVYTSPDVMGVALGGSVKNVVAIACGIADGLGYGHNTKAFLITRGLREMCRIAKVKGAEEATCYGLAGIGDLIVTGGSNLSRNFQFGLLLGKGMTAAAAKEKIGMVVEGEYTTLSAYRLGKEYNLDLPIIDGMYAALYGGASASEAIKKILERETRDERE